MTVSSRRFASVPTRTATETWRAIIDCFGPPPDARRILGAATNALALVIAEEVPSTEPIVLTGCGPQIRVYTVYGQDSIEGHNVSERPVAGLTFNPGWRLHVPPGDDAELVGGLLDGPHVVVGPPPVDDAASAEGPLRVSSFDLTALE